MKRMLKLASVVALVLVVAGISNAQVIRMEVTASEEFNLLANPPVGAMVSPGVTFCPGHEQPAPFQPCPAGSRTAQRGVQILTKVIGETGADPRIGTGWNLIEFSGNFNANGTGRVWGKFTVTLDDHNGTWEGVFTGERTFVNGEMKEILRGTGHGSGGLVEGMEMKFTLVNTPTSPYSYTGQMTGVITQLPIPE